MGFTLKTYFMGLVAFAVRSDDSQVTVLMIDARDGYYTSDGCPIGVHVPLLLTRAHRCAGAECMSGFEEANQALFGEDTDHTRLAEAIDGGSAWVLDNSDLSVSFEGARSGLRILRMDRGRTAGKDPLMPRTPDEQRAFDWVAQLAEARLDPDVLGPAPSKGLVAARFTLEHGTLGTCKLVSTDEETISALSFAPVSEIVSGTAGTGNAAPARGQGQAMSDWLVAEIEIPGDSVKLTDRNFVTGKTRSIELSPEVGDGSGVVEAALINLPLASFADPDMLPPRPESMHEQRCGPHDVEEIMRRERPLIGRHFELFYELAECRPPLRLRPVPYLPALSAQEREKGARIKVGAKPPGKVGSALVRALLPDPSRGAYSRPICPVATLVAQ